MQLTILADNNTFIDEYLLGEPALSIYIEHAGKSLLFDAGYSDVFIQNADKLGINLKNLDYLLLSHGHNDHTWGLSSLEQRLTQNPAYKKPMLVAHPLVFEKKIDENGENIGSRLSKQQAEGFFDLNLVKSPFAITDKLIFLGEIPRINDFESQTPIGKSIQGETWLDDYLLDDSALVYKSKHGLVIITGCSHSGICNIVSYAQQICEDDRVVDITGGFHLLKPSQDILDKTVNFLKRTNPKAVHPCHCTDFKSKVEMLKYLNVKEVGVGLKLIYD